MVSKGPVFKLTAIRSLMAFLYAFGLSSVFAMLLSFSCAQNSVLVRSPCLYNSTHCSCHSIERPGTCLRHLGGNSCLIDKCSSTGLTCDCSGTSICNISSCKTWLPSVNVPTGELHPGEAVSCTMSRSSTRCLTKTGETVEAATTQKPKEYRMVQFGVASAYTMFNMTAFLDEGNFIAKTYAMHGKWNHVERLRRRYITLRMYESDGIPGRMLCAVYNRHDYEEDGMGTMRVEVNITGVSGQNLQWAACDDEGECYDKDETTLIGLHGLMSKFADGWCVKPLESKTISVRFYMVDGMKGIVLQSSTGSDQEFLFGDENANGMKGSLNMYGLVQNGEVPEILFNLQGIEIPFREVQI